VIVKDNGLWRPPSDPNARTQGVAPGGLPRPRRAEAEPERTAMFDFGPPADGPGTEPGTGSAGPRARRASRRRVLYAAGGVMLLAGGGVAAAMTADRRPGTSPAADGGPAAPPRSSAPTRAAGAPRSPAAPAGSPTPAGPAVATQPQWYVDDDGPMAIALTMDDGPHPVYTPQVLEIFRRYGIKATFNMIGSQVGANLSLVREVSAEGHTITNHTWDHADLTHCSYSEVVSEMDRCNDALARAGQSPAIFRAPYGNWSRAVFEACAAKGLKPVGWSVDPRDWDTAHVDTRMIVDNVMRDTRAHDIILEHDGGGDRRNTVAALKIFIPELLDRGFDFVAM
jgi:peptidoglycan/xylan/chitin deacetylase (PgdA/CDA1 family)